jgi:hypothetical protein
MRLAPVTVIPPASAQRMSSARNHPLGRPP